MTLLVNDPVQGRVLKKMMEEMGLIKKKLFREIEVKEEDATIRQFE